MIRVTPLVVAVVAALLTVTPLLAQAPIPRALLEAKTVYLVNGGIKAKGFDRLAKDLHAWKRFQIVDDDKAADVIVTLKTQGKAVGGSLYLSIMAPGVGQTELWGDTVGPIWTESSGAAKLVKRLRAQLEAGARTPTSK